MSSSEESLSARLESRVHRCVRGSSPGLVLPVGNFEQLAKVRVRRATAVGSASR